MNNKRTKSMLPESKGSILKRAAAVLLSVTMLPLMELPAITDAASPVTLASKTMNASKAIGINNDAAPDGFDEDDDKSNPYGRKTVVFGDAEEVYSMKTSMSDGSIIGDDVSNVGSKCKNEITCQNTQWVDRNGNEVKRFISDIAICGYPRYWSNEKWKSNLPKAVAELQRNGYDVVTYSNTLDGDRSLEGTDLAAGKPGDANMHRLFRGDEVAKYNIAIGYKYTDDANEAIKDVMLFDDAYSEIKKYSTHEFNGRYYQEPTVFGDSEFRSNNGYLNMGYNWDENGAWTLYMVYTKQNKASSSEVTAVTGLSMYPHGKENSNSYLGVGSFYTNGDGKHVIRQEHTDLNAGLDHYWFPEMYLHQTTVTVRPLQLEGSTVSGKAKIQEKSAINKTAGGNFDGNTEGQKNHFAMVAAVDGELQLAVVEAKDPENSQTVKTIGTYSDKSEVTLAAQMSIASGDFDGNGIDDIAVYNPFHTDGSRVEIYSKTGSGSVDDINSWEIKRTIAVTPDDVVSLSVGDINNDGIDDLVVAANDGVNVYSGARKNMLSENEQICENSEAINFSATVFRDKIAGQYQNFIAVLGAGKETLTSGKLSVFSRDNKGNYTAVATTEAYLGNINVLTKLKYQLELVYADGRLVSPYFNMQTYIFEEGKLTEKKLSKLDNSNNRFSFVYYKEDMYRYLPYDIQVADLNGTGEETVFFKTMIADEKGTIHTRSFSAITPTEKDSIYMSSTINKSQDTEYCYAVVNTDNDSSYLTYTGKHWFSYTDPAVLAVLASPPYFKDLLEKDDLSGDYPGSITSYGKTKGSGSSNSEAATISVGAYIRYEQDFSMFGVKVASIEAEVETMANFTTEFEQASEISYTTEYTTSSGADAVVFYSIPYEFYEYDMVYYFNGEKYTNKQTIAIPKQPCTSTVEMEKYKQISSMYHELPQLSDDVLRHTLGKPETYPQNTMGYHNVQEFDGNYMAVDFTSVGGGMSQSQSIEMNEENGNSYSTGVDVTVSAGAGAGGVTVGVKAGVGAEASWATTSTNGCAFTAEMQNMPKEAEEYGYGMSWKLFAHDGTYTDYKGNTVSFPVVDYLVTDVIQPPLIPRDFHQNYQESTQNSIRLEWKYEDPSIAEKFNIYRITNINGRDSAVLVGSVAASGGTKEDDGIYSYVFKDSGQCENSKNIIMNSGTKFDYSIEAVRSFAAPPSVSMPGDTISAYTLPDAEYPDIVLKGVENNKLTLYPDRDYTITADVQNADNFLQLSYQWQKRDSKNNWKNIKGGNTKVFEITNATSEDAGQYRCRIDAIYYNEEHHEKSAFSITTDEIDVAYQMRTVKNDSFTVSCKESKPEAILTLFPEDPYCFVAPTGDVRFIIRSTSLEKSFTVPLKNSGKKATAKLSTAADLSELPEGVYEITAYYSGDNVFSSFAESSKQSVLVGESKIYPVLMNENGERTDTFYYGDKMFLKFLSYTKDADGNSTETEMKDETHPDGYSELLTKKPDIYVNNEIKVKLQGFDDEQTFQYTYTVKKRPLAVRVISEELFAGDVEGHLPQMDILSGSLAADDVLSDIVDLTFKNSTGTTNVSITNNTNPGTYFAQLSVLSSETAENYDIKLYSYAFTINSQQYTLMFSAEPCEGKQAGTISLTLPETKSGITSETFYYESGTKLKFTAEANNGYKFDHWVINNEEYTTKTVTKNMLREAMSVQVFFKPYNGIISIDEAELSRVETPEGFENGKEYPVGTELTFTAQNNENSLFDHWVKVTGSKTTELYTNSITLTVSDVPVMLYPVFSDTSRELPIGEKIYSYDLGDVNNDRQINSVDASSVLAYYAKVSTDQDGGFSDAQKAAADVNNDGSVNSVDASKILAYYAYVSTTQEEDMTIEKFVNKTT